MKKYLRMASINFFLLATVMSQAEEHMHDHGENPLLTHLLIDQLEIRDTDDGELTALEGQMWIGKDINKFWLKTDVLRRDGKMQESEVQALYSRAISPFWDAQIGVRHDAQPIPTRNWGVIGIQGLAPYWFDIDSALFVGESGRVAARISAEYDLLFTQKLILSPNVEVNLYGQNDAATATGSGLSYTKAGLRLRYEIRREIAPYVGIHWKNSFGKTAELEKKGNQSTSDAELVAGVRVSF